MIADNLNNYRIILASRSPRRQQLLRDMGLNFEVVTRDFDESFPEGLTGEEVAMHVAHAKAVSFRNEMSDNEIIITADTIVWCNSEVLGKPTDPEDAARMLREISGNTHDVITGVSIFTIKREVTFSVSTSVTFDTLTEDEIRYYVNNFSPYDKAGAYGIQEWIGIIGCSHIEGSYFNVVGLPVQRLYKELQNFVLPSDPIAFRHPFP
jgi:septum formation protein